MEMVAFDFETWLTQDGLLAPKIVCGAWCSESEKAQILLTNDSLKKLEELLKKDCILVGANIAYDFACACAARPDMTQLVFNKYEKGQIWDVLVVAALDAVAGGHLFLEKDGTPLKGVSKDGKPGKIARRYSLELCTRIYLGRNNAKENDEYRLRYAELDGVPLEQWPEVAREYPQDDVRNTLEVGLAQRDNSKNIGLLSGKDWTHVTHQSRAAFTMHLSSVWGLRADLVAVQTIKAKVLQESDKIKKVFTQAGFLRLDGSKNTNAVKKAVIEAYSTSVEKCAPCQGSGKVPGKGKAKKNCEACSGSGLKISASVPRTASEGVCCDRDTLSESGNEILESFADASLTDKIKNTYIPFLEKSTKTPINVRSNVLVATGRASYDGLIQLLPREGGIRDCFVPTKGKVFCSVDYAALEMCTLAQVCLWTVGESRMAQEINRTGDPGSLHTVFGAKMLGVDQTEFQSLVKKGDKAAKNGRQMAKAANFGFPGGMGAAKLVLAKRKEGLRFCVASGEATVCGVEKVTSYNNRDCPPTCVKCIEVAEGLRAQWFNTWPEMKEYFEWVGAHENIRDGEAEIDSPGTGYIRGGLGFADGANHSFQSLASFGAKQALWKVSKACYTERDTPLFGCRPVLFAHDEIISELSEKDAHISSLFKADLMVKAMREFVPDVAIKAEPALARRMYKGMEPAYKDGKLVCWEPK